MQVYALLGRGRLKKNSFHEVDRVVDVTQNSNSWAKSIGFDNDGSNGHSTKDSILKVRAIRYF